MENHPTALHYPMTASPSRFLTTLHFPRRPEWTRRSDCITSDDPSALIRVLRIVLRTRAGVPVVLNGMSTADQVAAVFMSIFRRRVPLVITDATWKDIGGLDGLLTRCAVRVLATSQTIFCVSSQAERQHWPARWGVPSDQVTIVHWYHGTEDAAMRELCRGDGRVFSGGHSLRDYRTLVAAAERLRCQLDIAADAGDLPTDPLPSNVRVQSLSRADFHRRLQEASVVVVPLQDARGRSAGQTTFLDSMALGGLVCVSNILGISEHIVDRRTGLLVPPGDVDALEAALAWALDPANADEVMEIRRAARGVARTRFSPERFTDAVLAVVDRIRSGNTPPR